MPTGYTADVKDGKVTDFRTFALRCARNFGATIMQRDDPGDDPPKHREMSEYERKRLADAREDVVRYQAMSEAEAERRAEFEFYEQLADYEKRVAETKMEQDRYDAMLVKVARWTPPTSQHEGMKKFMIEQLVTSKDFDHMEWSGPTRYTGRQWLSRKREHAAESLARAEKGWREEQERVDGANAWIDALYASLPT